MIEGAVPGFRPSVNGFPFANAWPHVAPIRLGVGAASVGVGDASRGLCGGMVFTVADLAASGIPTPRDPQPADGSRRFRYIVRRQVESFDWLRLPARFYAEMVSSAERRARTSLAAAASAREAIDAGRLAMLGLVRVASRNPLRLTENHQVLAWRYADDGASLRLGLYDPNHPGDDAVELALELGDDRRTIGSMRQSTGEPLLGILVAPYVAADPRPFRTGPAERRDGM